MFLYTDYGRAEEPHDAGGVVAKLFHNPIGMSALECRQLLPQSQILQK
jgi:hypothetical protein